MANFRHPQPWHDLTVELNGMSYVGRYQVDGGIVLVCYEHGGMKGTQLGAAPPHIVAGELLLEIIEEHERDVASRKLRLF